MLKTYKTTATAMSLVVKVNGVVRRLEFKRFNVGNGYMGCAYTTDNVDKQKAIESHEYFGRNLFPYIWTDDVEPVEEVVEEVKEEPVVEATEEVKEVTTEKVEKRKYNKKK